MEQDYDEFGNYIGVSLDEEEEEVVFEEPHEMQVDEEEEREELEVYAVDREYYPSAAEVYGSGVETVVHDEDTLPITVPIIAPPKQTISFSSSTSASLYNERYNYIHKPYPEFINFSFLKDIRLHPSQIRNVCFAGHIHHGKTAFADSLVHKTHETHWSLTDSFRFTDTHPLEVQRGISIKAMPLSLILQSSNSKSWNINILDCPGHSDFIDETDASLRISDAACIFVDAVEGVMATTEIVLKAAVKNKLPIMIVLNKIDRLILELRLPPLDAYFKLKYTLEEINKSVAEMQSALNWEMYALPVDSWDGHSRWNHLQRFIREAIPVRLLILDSIDHKEFAKRLWGDVYFDTETRKFVRNAVSDSHKRTFVYFLMEPIYKIYTQVLAENTKSLESALFKLNVSLKPAQLSMDVKPLMAIILSEFLGVCGFVDMVVQTCPTPLETAHLKTVDHWTGSIETNPVLYKGLTECDPTAPLVIQIVKSYNSEDVSSFSVFGRVMSGKISSSSVVRVHGDRYTPEDEEDMSIQQVTGLYIFQSRYKVKVDEAVAGSWVLISGIEATIVKTATITDASEAPSPLHIFQPLRYSTKATLKIAIEPVNPTELPKMLEGLRKVSKSYMIMEAEVEESGEHVVLGTGELYLDCILHDIRRLYAEIEIKVSDPVVKFCETVVEVSAIKCFAETQNKKNKLIMIAEPLDKGLAEDIENRVVSFEMGKKGLESWFMEKYNWDVLASRNIWAFGPSLDGPNILLNDTLFETDKKVLNQARDNIVQGFQWATKQGPLADEAIRNVKFKILDATITPGPINSGRGQIIPAARRVCYSSFLMAAPRLLEPIYYVEIQAPADCVSAIYTVLSRRRGHIIQDLPKPGSPLYTVKAFLPVIDSNGFETDLRTHTQGQAFCQQIFHHWELVPGDPLDTSIVLKALEPSPAQHLARDFMVKTRRRKGLSEDVAVSKFFDDLMLARVEGGVLGL